MAVSAALIKKLVSRHGQAGAEKRFIEITGQKKFAKLQRKVIKEAGKIDDKLQKWLVRAAFLAEGGAKKSATVLKAVDTGLMRSSIRLNKLTRFEARVGPNVDYAFYVHEGLGSNAKYGRRPFLELGAKIAATAIRKSGNEMAKKIKFGIEK